MKHSAASYRDQAIKILCGHDFSCIVSVNRTLGWEACLHTAILGNGNLVVGWGGDGANGNGIYLTMFKLLDDKTESLKKP